MKKKLTKADIEKLAMEIIDFLKKKDMESDVSIYFNNKVMRSKTDWNTEQITWKTEENVSPLDYFEYANHEHILSMTFEGELCDAINNFGKTYDQLWDVFRKYGLYFELGDSWNLTASPSDDDMEIETTNYAKPEMEEFIYLRREDVPRPLKLIMELWHYLSKTVGDKGSCVIGAGFKFRYEGKLYFMSACSPYQGSISWETHKDTVKEMLEGIGATEIIYDWGRLD